jgi:Gas vesicle synthesis protein GvpL/GvpF
MPAASKTSKSKSGTRTTRAASPGRGSRRSAHASRGGNAAPKGLQRANAPSDAPYVYVYCAVRGAVSARVLTGLRSLPGAKPPRALVITDTLSLIVADVPADAYRAENVEARLGDLDWVGRCGSAHHAVAEALAPTHTIAPLRPFTLFSSEERARARFSSLVRNLDTALERVSGKAEWVLRIGTPDRALISERTPEATGRVVSGATFLAQKAAARQSTAERAARVRGDAAALFRALSTVADQADQREPDPGTGLLLDAAFLVSRRRSAAFKRKLQAGAKGLLRDGCRVSLTGPWPPYSFVALTSEPEVE